MPTNRQTDPYGGRFARDVSQSGVAAGYQQAVSKLDRDLVRRNIAPYKKYGFEQSLRKLAGMNDQQRYDESAAAVVARFRDNRPGKPPAGGAPKPPSGGGRPSSGGGSKAPPKGSGKPPAKKGGPTPAQRRKARQKAADIARRAAAAAEEVRRKRAALEARRRAGLKPPAQNSPPRQKPTPVVPKPGAGGRARPE